MFSLYILQIPDFNDRSRWLDLVYLGHLEAVCMIKCAIPWISDIHQLNLRILKKSRMRHEVSSRWSSRIESPRLASVPLPELSSDERAQIKEYASQFAGPKEKFTQIMYESALYLQFAGSSQKQFTSQPPELTD